MGFMGGCPEEKFFKNTAGATADDAETPPASEDWRTVSLTWGGNTIRGKLVSVEAPDFDTLSVTLEDLDLSDSAFSGAAIPDA